MSVYQLYVAADKVVSVKVTDNVGIENIRVDGYAPFLFCVVVIKMEILYIGSLFAVIVSEVLYLYVSQALSIVTMLIFSVSGE